MKRNVMVVVLLLLISLPVSADTLYQRLGGADGVAAVVGELIDTAASDPLTARSFQQDVDLARVKRLLAEQLCEASGGGCRYSGDDMRQVHAGLQISTAEFDGLAGQLQRILDKYRVAAADQQALLALLAGMRQDIVTVK